MTISYDQARDEDEFHVAHSGLPCTIWRKSGSPLYDLAPEGWMIFLTDPETGDWGHITDLTAGDYHVPADCPRRVREDRPPGSHTIPLAGLDDGYDEDGFDADGYDREGFDAEGYDRNGDNADGYSRDTDASDLDLRALWSAFTHRRATWTSTTRETFREHLRAMLPGRPDEADDLAFCGSCDAPAWDGDLNSVQDGALRICEPCWDDWMTCDSCDDRYPSSELTETLSGSDICDGCRSEYYTYCEDCNGYYHDEDAGDHAHDDDDSGSCCASPQQEFAIRNDGCDPLAADTRVTVTLPSGVISEVGLQAICRCLYSHGLYLYSEDTDALGVQWQTKAGNFTKRLSRHAYTRHHVKLPPEALSQVGCIARDHSTAVSVEIDITRDLNRSSGDFYHDGSCWWGCYSESRCALKTNGGFGLRSFSGHAVSGRAWVMPLRKDARGRLVPTFETMTPDAFVVFNGYGDLSGYAAPRVLAHMAGWTYRKIAFECSPMYVNAGGYLIAPESLAEQYTDGRLMLSADEHSSLFRDEQAARKELVDA